MMASSRCSPRKKSLPRRVEEMLTGPRGLFLIAGQEKVVTVDLERVLTAPPVEHLTVHSMAEMVVPELAPRVSRAVLGAADDARSLPGRRPVDRREHRLLLRAAPSGAFRPRSDIEVVGLHAVSSKDAGRTPIWPSRSVSSRAPFLPSSSCSLSAPAARMRSLLPSGWT